MSVRSFSEKRWVVLDETPGPGGSSVLGAVSEVKPIVADPNATPPQMFHFQGPGSPITRPQLEALGQLIEAALTDAPESKILPVPPGTRLR